MPSTKKKTPTQKRKDKDKYAGLNPALHPKVRAELIDHDYIHKLSDKEKEWLSKFNEEYVGASLAPAKEKRKWKKDFHSTKELRKDCTDRNNWRNNDVLGKGRTHGWISDIESNITNIESTSNPGLTEDAVIKDLDKKKVFLKKYTDKFGKE